MGWLNSIFDTKPEITTTNSTQTSNNSAVSSTGPDNWMTAAGKKNYDLAAKSVPLSFKPYKSERVAKYGLGYDQSKGTLAQMVGDLGRTYGYNRGLLQQLWNNDKGAMGKTAADYMNPYTEAVLTPQLRALNEQRQLQLNEDNRAATMAGAFGDPQAGIAKALSNDRYNQTTADTTSRAYKEAYDAGRAEHESALARLMQLPGMFQGLDRENFDQNSQIAKAQANFGMADQAYRQKLNDVKYDNWLKKTGWRLNRAQTLNQLLAGTPHNNNQVATSTGSGTGSGWGSTPGQNDGMQLLGKVAGSALGGGFGEKLGDWLFS